MCVDETLHHGLTIDTRDSPGKSIAHSSTDEERSIVVQESPMSILTMRDVSSPEETVDSREVSFHRSSPASRSFELQETTKYVCLSSDGEELKFEHPPFNDDAFVRNLCRKITNISRLNKTGELTQGMGCLVRDGENLYLYSCRHNFSDGLAGKDEEKYLFSFPYTNDWAAKKVRLPFLTKARLPKSEDAGPEYELRGETQVSDELRGTTLLWAEGYEVARFQIPNDEEGTMDYLNDHARADFFTLPDEHFQYVQGMRVALMEWGVKYSHPATKKKIPRPRHLGEEMDINIFTGEISIVGTKHIECNYNSFHGCSGGAVVCIDPRYERYIGTLIAIHVGCSSKFKTSDIQGFNVAFKITGEEVQQLIASCTIEDVREKLTTHAKETSWFNTR